MKESLQPEGRSAIEYQLYGCTLASDFSFRSKLPRGRKQSDLSFACMAESPFPAVWNEAKKVYESSSPDEEHIDTYVYQHPSCDVLRFADIADFYVWSERIICHLRDTSYDYAVEIWLLGSVLSYWFERQGIPALHASSVVIEDKSVAFVSTNRGGKTSLAAAFMQADFPLLTDDIILVEKEEDLVIGRPGYPQMRMWPEQAAHFLGSDEGLEPVHPFVEKRRIPVGDDGLGTFSGESLPLACFYLPERRAQDDVQGIRVASVSPQEALVHLVKHSFLAHTVDAVGWQPKRLALLAEITRRVPVRRLVYPSGMEYLPAVRQAILDDMRA